MIKVLFLVVGSIARPSTRFRVYQFLPLLKARGISPTVLHPRVKRPFSFLEVFRLARNVDVVFIQRRTFPLFFFRFLRRLNPRIVYDFDDAIYAAPPFIGQREKRYREKIRRQLNNILKGSKAVIAGNPQLAGYALQFNKNVFIIPSVPAIPRDSLGGGGKQANVTLGWIGTRNNLYYLEAIRGILEALGKKYEEKVFLKVVSDGEFRCQHMHTESKKWRMDEEAEDIMSFDIGLMPLTDDEWSRGKCGFKILQYMSCGIPCVASPVGINTELIEKSQAGFVTRGEQEWIAKISVLIENEHLRKEMGKCGRKFVKDFYSRECVLSKLVEVLRSVRGSNEEG